MKSRRKTIPAYIIEPNSVEVSQNGTPMRQMSITEAFKYSKPKTTPFKMESPFISSSVCFEISDSDSETPELGLPVLPKVEPYEEIPEIMEAPSPPKVPKLMICVNKPGTPKHQASTSAPQGTRIGVQSTPNSKALFSGNFVSPSSDTSERTIPYEFLEITSDCYDEATVPFPQNGSPNKEVLVLNDPNDFEENAVDSFLVQPNKSKDLQSKLSIQNTPNVSNGSAVRRLDFNITEKKAPLNQKEKKCKRSKTKTADSKEQDEKCTSKDISQETPKPKKQRKRKINTDKITEDKNTVKENSSPNQNCNNSSEKIVVQSIATVRPGKKPTKQRSIDGNNTNDNLPRLDVETINKDNPQPKVQPVVSTFDTYILALAKSMDTNSKKDLNSTIKKLNLNSELSVTTVELKKCEAILSSNNKTRNSTVESTPKVLPLTGGQPTLINLKSSKKESINKIQKESPNETIQKPSQTKIKPTSQNSSNPSKGPEQNPQITQKKIIADDQQPCSSRSLEKNYISVKQMTPSSATAPTSKIVTTAVSSAKQTLLPSNVTSPTSKNVTTAVSSAKQTLLPSSAPSKGATCVSSAKQTTPTKVTTPTKQKMGPNSPVKGGSPRRKLSGSPNKQSPVKNRQIKSLKSKEGKQLQVKQMDELEKLFKIVKANRHLRSLLNPREYQILQQFETMADNKKYFLMKLFVWKRTWYNIFSFCQKAQVEGDDKDIIEIFEYLRDEELVDTEYKVSADPLELLDKLDYSKVKEIMNEFRIRPIKSKGHNVRAILALMHSQSTLTCTKSIKDLVMDKIEKKMGFAIKIKQNVFDALYYAYLLGTFTNPDFGDPQSYFKAIVHDNVVFPETHVEDYPVFYSREKFESFARALKLRKTLEEQLVNKKKQDKFIGVYNIGEEAYGRLLTVDNPDDHPLAPHLKRFTASHVYTGILSTCCEHIYTKENGRPAEVKKWLEFLLKKFPASRRTAKWYRRLIWLHMRHLEEINYEVAANLLIEVLDTKKHLLGEIDTYELGTLGKTLKASKRYKIDAIYHDRVAQLIPRPIDDQMFPQQQIDSECIRSDVSGKKRAYISRTGGETIISHVEQVALNYYAQNGFPGGDHGEGRPIKALLMLFFWDIIYDPARVIPGTFISPIQNAPLDMFTPHFYHNRADAIEERLRQIDFQWSDDKVIEFAASNWQTHSHEDGAFGMTINAIPDEVTIEVYVTVIGRRVLAKILERLIKNLREFRSGMPDLLVWNIDEKRCKFVEVKGENDSLSTGQKLWLRYLQQIGASIEVCHVHSMGSKRKKIPKCVGGDSPEKGKSTDEEEANPSAS